MPGLLQMPLNYREGTLYPLVVNIHGGEIGSSINLYGAILVSIPLK
jgi:hypothetical protein